MLASQLMDLRGMLHSQGVIFAYSGYVTEPVLSGVGEALKQKLTIDDADTKTLRSVFAVFVEQMQNIIRYSAEKAQSALAPASDPRALMEIRYGILTIGREGTDYMVCAGNLVERADVERLRAKLSRIRDMSKDELKALYKEQLRAEPEEGSKGAGLGFMEIARRASKPIEFDFTDVDATHALFALKSDHLRVGSMRDKLDIQATTRTPAVSFDFMQNHLKITGESYPEDVTEFYGPVFTALDSYLSKLGSGTCRFDFELIYLNSSSAKAIMMLMDKLDAAAKKGAAVDVYWYYDKEDDTMQELGEEFGEDLENAKFHLEKMPG